MITFVQQPEGALRLGDYLKLHLQEKRWTHFRAAIAFIKHSGVRHIFEELSEFSRRAAVKLSVGIDCGGTSMEGLRGLLDAVESHGEIWVYHNEIAVTFHPKLYLFKNDKYADIFIGSGNLTEGGLYTNYEASLLLSLDLAEENNRKLLWIIENTLDDWSSPVKGTCLRLSYGLLDKLVENGDVPPEAQARETEEESSVVRKGRSKGKRGFFAGAAVPRAPKVVVKRRQQRAGKGPVIHTLGPLLWKKSNLPASDVLMRKRLSTHPTGGLRLTQADFKVRGKQINQTTYFRKTVFGNLPWKLIKKKPKVEEVVATFRAKILGEDFGTVRLKISHKPSGEAGQGNYTTLLHWGDFGDKIKELDLVGKTFYLYGPSERATEPFFIEIDE